MKTKISRLFILILLLYFAVPLFSITTSQHIYKIKKHFLTKKKLAQEKKIEKKVRRALNIFKVILSFSMWILLSAFILLLIMMFIKYILVQKQLEE